MQPGETVRVARRDAGERCRGERAVSQQRRACQRVRPSARPADRKEPIDAELVGDRRNVCRAVGDGSVSLSVRPAVAGTRIRDVAQPPLGPHLNKRRDHVPALGVPAWIMTARQTYVSAPHIHPEIGDRRARRWSNTGARFGHRVATFAPQSRNRGRTGLGELTLLAGSKREPQSARCGHTKLPDLGGCRREPARRQRAPGFPTSMPFRSRRRAASASRSGIPPVFCNVAVPETTARVRVRSPPV